MFDPERWTRATVVSRHVWEDGLWTMGLDRSVDFQAGQFVMLALEIGGEPVKRAYSISSAPGEPVEFYVVRVDDGELTPHLWALREGDPVWMGTKASGMFTLERVEDGGVLWLVGTGTGLAPYISMLREGSLFARWEHVVLVHGVRYARELSYREELEAMAAENPQLSYVPTVTREETCDLVWGRITDLLEQGVLERVAHCELGPEGHHVMLCGNPDMVRCMMDLLKARGLTLFTPRRPGQIHVERYW